MERGQTEPLSKMEASALLARYKPALTPKERAAAYELYRIRRMSGSLSPTYSAARTLFRTIAPRKAYVEECFDAARMLCESVRRDGEGVPYATR